MDTGTIALISSALAVIGIIINNITTYKNNQNRIKWEKEQAALEQARIDRDLALKKEIADREKVADEKNDVRINSLSLRLEVIESISLRTENKVDMLTQEKVFRKGFSKSIKDVASDSTDNQLLSFTYKSMLEYWVQLINKFGIDYWDNEIRENSRERERFKHLNKERMILVGTFSTYINSKIETIKKFKNNTVRFSDFLEANNIYNSLDVLIIDLARNHINESIYKDKFLDHIDKFCELFVSCTVEWGNLDRSILQNKEVA